MTDQNTALLQQLGAQLGAMQNNAASGWNQPAVGGVAAMIQGVAVPINLDTPAGKIRCYLSLPAEAGQNPQSLQAALAALANAGYPLDAWQPRDSGGGGSWGGNGNGGGWNSGGGGYGGGYRRGGYGGYGGGRRY